MSHEQHFDTVDVLRLEVETDPTGLVNMVQNPSGDLGGWGWVTPVASSTMEGVMPSGIQSLKYTSPGSVASYFYTEPMAIAATQYAAASMDFTVVYGYYRIKFEWLNSSQVLLSSSTQSGYLNSTGTVNYGPYQAPASTAYVRLRIDHYSTNAGANPTAGQTLRFREVAVSKAAVSGDLGTVRTNLVTNPSFEVNTTGWTVSPGGDTVTRSTAQFHVGTASAALTGGSTGGVKNKVSIQTAAGTSGMPVTAGQTYALSFWVRAPAVTATAEGSVHLYDSSGAWIAQVQFGASSATTTNTWVKVQGVISVGASLSGKVPAYAAVQIEFIGPTDSDVAAQTFYVDEVLFENASSVGTYFDGATTDAGGWDYAWTGAAHASTSTATSSNLSYIEPVPYLNILQECKEIRVNRAALDVGTLSAEVLSTALDPSTSDLIRPGRKVRLMTDNSFGDWYPLFTGKVANATVTYELKDPDVPESKRARVVLTAVDAVAALAQQKRSEGVASIDDLPYVLEGCGVPWNVNGNGNQVTSATISAVNESASALDQVAVTRDSNMSFAWVDRYGVLQATDALYVPSPGSTQLSIPYYRFSDLDISFNTDDCINEVWIKYLRYNATTQETEEVAYGPYRDETSIAEWGVRSAEFTVAGIGEGTVATYAASILTANATPEVTVNSVTCPISESDAFYTVLAGELYDHTIVNIDGAAYEYTDLRVTQIEHSITPEKWLVKYDFSQDGTVASPQFVPSPPANNGALDGTWITPTLSNTWVNYGSPYAGVGYMRKNGIVYLKGLIRLGNANTMFTLPAGYRPAEARIFPAVGNYILSGGASAGTAHTHQIPNVAGRIDVTAAGVVSVVGITTLSNLFTSLDGVSFPAEA